MVLFIGCAEYLGGMRVNARQHKSNQQLRERFTLASLRFLDRADSVIYAITGVCFFFAALLALVYAFWAFGVSIIGLHTFPMDQQPGRGAQALIEFISGLLLVLIIVEMLGTVIHFLQTRATSLRPFLFIGIVSATRSILSIGARLSVEGLKASASDFLHAMIELGVNGAVILALGITLKLLGRMAEIDESIRERILE